LNTTREKKKKEMSKKSKSSEKLIAKLMVNGDGIQIQGFPGKHYCPRMLSMNKPTYAAIRTYSPDKPTLVFVSSRCANRNAFVSAFLFLERAFNDTGWLS